MLIPYDGKDIGKFIGDASRKISSANYVLLGFIIQDDVFVSNASNQWAFNSGGNTSFRRGYFNTEGVTPTAYENRPASVSALVCISY